MSEEFICWRVEAGYPACPVEWPGQPVHWCPQCRLEHGLDGPEPGWESPLWYLPLALDCDPEPAGPGWSWDQLGPSAD